MATLAAGPRLAYDYPRNSDPALNFMNLRTQMYRHRARLRDEAKDLNTEQGRISAFWYVFIYDHGGLRLFWTNTYDVSPGVVRSNQPSPERLEKFAKAGGKTVMNLRGASGLPHYVSQEETCKDLGLALVNIEHFSARLAPHRSVIQTIIEVMRNAGRPVMFHCKSGADRTSLTAAIYLIVFENASVAHARKQLALRYLHFKWTPSGVLDFILDSYEEAQTRSGISFEDWLNTDYDNAQIQAAYNAARNR